MQSFKVGKTPAAGASGSCLRTTYQTLKPGTFIGVVVTSLKRTGP
jgi:hypothetical protein